MCNSYYSYHMGQSRVHIHDIALSSSCGPMEAVCFGLLHNPSENLVSVKCYSMLRELCSFNSMFYVTDFSKATIFGFGLTFFFTSSVAEDEYHNKEIFARL
ncbi:UNVERIFIED_CONTAM: hypothetical protein K2H54_038378 [Gekko kuhli]